MSNRMRSFRNNRDTFVLNEDHTKANGDNIPPPHHTYVCIMLYFIIIFWIEVLISQKSQIHNHYNRGCSPLHGLQINHPQWKNNCTQTRTNRTRVSFMPWRNTFCTFKREKEKIKNRFILNPSGKCFCEMKSKETKSKYTTYKPMRGRRNDLCRAESSCCCYWNDFFFMAINSFEMRSVNRLMHIRSIKCIWWSYALKASIKSIEQTHTQTNQNRK